MKISQFAKVLGRRGGRMRAKRLSAEERRRIAAIGGRARAASLAAARRIAVNFRYLALVSDLQGRSAEVTRLRTFAGRLPGVYPSEP